MAKYKTEEYILEALNKQEAIKKARDLNKKLSKVRDAYFLPPKAHLLVNTIRSEPKGTRGRYACDLKVLTKCEDTCRLKLYEALYGKPLH
jgi:hypothetical protein